MTKSEQTALIESLTIGNANKIQKLEALDEEIRRLTAAESHSERRRARLGDDFLQLWRDERTLRLRYQWLEEAATNVVSSCPEHLPGLIVKLADELGIEINEET